MGLQVVVVRGRKKSDMTEQLNWTDSYFRTAGGASPVPQQKRILLPMQEMQVDPWVRKSSWRRKWQSSPTFLPGESWTEEPPWGHKDLN